MNSVLEDHMVLTMDEAAAELKLTRTQLYELTRKRCRQRMAHPIPYVKFGKRILFQRQSLLDWIRTMEQRSA